MFIVSSQLLSGLIFPDTFHLLFLIFPLSASFGLVFAQLTHRDTFKGHVSKVCLVTSLIQASVLFIHATF